MKSSIAACAVLTAFSVFACSSDENNATPGGGDSGTTGGSSGTSNTTGGKSNGGMGGTSNAGTSGGGTSNAGTSGGGTSGGGGAAGGGGTAGGGGSNGGTSGSGNGGASDASAPDGSTPDGTAPIDAGACVWIDLTNPAQCNKGVKIKDYCPPGRVPAGLNRCSDGVTIVPDVAYQENPLSTCPDTGCATDGNHVVFRKLECCYPSASDGGGVTDAGNKD